MSGSAQRPLTTCTIRETYWNKAGTESPAVGGIYLENSRALAKLWSVLVRCLPFFLSKPQSSQWTLSPTGGDSGIPATGPSLTSTPSCVLAREALAFITLSLFLLMVKREKKNNNRECCWMIGSEQLTSGKSFVLILIRESLKLITVFSQRCINK